MKRVLSEASGLKERDAQRFRIGLKPRRVALRAATAMAVVPGIVPPALRGVYVVALRWIGLVLGRRKAFRVGVGQAAADPTARVSALAARPVGARFARPGHGQSLLQRLATAKLASALLLLGCASGPAVDPVQVARNADAQQRVVSSLAREVAGLAPLVDVACALRGKESDTCKMLERGYYLARSSIEAARSAIRLYRELGYGLEAVEYAVRRLEMGAQDLDARLKGVRDAVTRMALVPPVGDGAAPARAEPPAADTAGEAVPGAVGAGAAGAGAP